MQVAIVSDSHYAVDRVKLLFVRLQETGIRYLIHAGDFIGQSIDIVLADYPEIKNWIARGNCDTDSGLIDSLNKMSHVTVGEILRFEIEGTSFIVSHIPGVALNAFSKNPADVIIHGHTHLPRIDRYNNALLLNPGSLMEGDGFMILSLPELTVDRQLNY